MSLSHRQCMYSALVMTIVSTIGLVTDSVCFYCELFERIRQFGTILLVRHSIGGICPRVFFFPKVQLVFKEYLQTQIR